MAPLRGASGETRAGIAGAYRRDHVRQGCSRAPEARLRSPRRYSHGALHQGGCPCRGAKGAIRSCPKRQPLLPGWRRCSRCPVDRGHRSHSRRCRHVVRRGELPRRGHPDRPGHGRAHRRAPHRPSARARRQRLRRAGVLRLGDGDRLQGRLHAERRQVDHHADDDGELQDQDHRAPARQPGPLQRDRDRRVDERVGRRVGTRLGLPQSDADARRLRLRRRLRAEARRGRWVGAPRVTGIIGPEHRAGRRRARPLRVAAPSRAISTRSICTPRSARPCAPRTRRRWAA